jgi:pimeloyl-ACP methyl ester carboxylesterase
MATYVLVHGSWTGGWVWKLVAERVRAAGHEVYHPTLDGCAERAQALRKGITLDTHGQEIADFLFFWDLNDVVLVGTSSGGMVIARAAELARERIQRLVFIDALCPMPGETTSQINGRPPRNSDELAYGLPPDQIQEHAFAGVPSPLREWAIARYTRHPSAPTEAPVDLHAFWSQTWQVDVLNSTQSPNPPGAHQRRTAEKLGGTYQEIDAGHYPMLSHPEEIAEYLLAMAPGAERPAGAEPARTGDLGQSPSSAGAERPPSGGLGQSPSSKEVLA